MPRTFRFLFIAALAGGIFSVSLLAQVSLEDRLNKLEQEVGALKKENQQLRSELGLEGRAGATLVKPAGREPTLSIGGLLQGQADFGDKGDSRFVTGNDRFYLRRARINVQGRFLEEFDFRIEGDFAGTIGETSANRAQLTDAFINWNRFDWANLKVGQFKTPFGFEQLSLDARLFGIERSLVNDRLTSSRQIGVQVSGELFDKRLAYATGAFNGTGVNISSNDNDKFLWAGRVNAVGWQGTVLGQDVKWNIGVDGLASSDSNLGSQPAEFQFDVVPGGTRDNIFTGKRRAGGIDTQLHVGPLDLWAEYLRERFSPTDGLPTARVVSDGWYVQATHFALPKELQALVKYDEFDPNHDLTHNRTRTWTFGGNWFLKGDDLKLQANYLLSDIDGVAQKNGKLILRFQTIF